MVRDFLLPKPCNSGKSKKKAKAQKIIADWNWKNEKHVPLARLRRRHKSKLCFVSGKASATIWLKDQSSEIRKALAVWKPDNTEESEECEWSMEESKIRKQAVVIQVSRRALRRKVNAWKAKTKSDEKRGGGKLSCHSMWKKRCIQSRCYQGREPDASAGLPLGQFKVFEIPVVTTMPRYSWMAPIIPGSTIISRKYVPRGPRSFVDITTDVLDTTTSALSEAPAAAAVPVPLPTAEMMAHPKKRTQFGPGPKAYEKERKPSSAIVAATVRVRRAKNPSWFGRIRKSAKRAREQEDEEKERASKRMKTEIIARQTDVGKQRAQGIKTPIARMPRAVEDMNYRDINETKIAARFKWHAYRLPKEGLSRIWPETTVEEDPDTEDQVEIGDTDVEDSDAMDVSGDGRLA